jgi:multidrug efflux system membrane fusion protein
MDDKTFATKPGADLRYQAAEAPYQRTTKGTNRWWLWLTALGAVSIGLYLWAARGRAPKSAPVAAAVPVSAIQAKQGDLNIYLSQIGTVTPLATVTIRSRVAGQIMELGFKEGQLIDANQPLMTIDPRPYQAQLLQYEGQLARDQATLANARITLERYHALYTQGVIARQDLDNQQALFDQARGAIQNDQGLIDGVKVNLSYCRVVSPIKGRIGLRQVDLGNYIQATDPLVVITQLQPISVLFTVPEDNIQEIVGDLSSGRNVPVQAWNRDFSRQLATGALVTFDNEVDQTTGTVKLRAQFANDDYALFPNEFVNARTLVNTLHDAILVPTAALQRTQQGAYVYVVQPDKTVARRPVVVSSTQGDVTALAQGLTSAELVVTDGLDRLQPGSKVAVRVDPGPAAPLVGVSPAQKLAGQ